MREIIHEPDIQMNIKKSDALLTEDLKKITMKLPIVGWSIR